MKLFKFCVFLLVLSFAAFVYGLGYHPLATANLLPFLPSIERMPLNSQTPKTVIKGNTELLLAKKSYVPLQDIPLSLRQAVVAVEDQRFYQHFGVDPYGIVRAVVNDFSQQDILEGASTITQQLARNLFLDQSQTAKRKITEIILALQLEDYYHNKDKILVLYLNNVYYGRNAWGIRDAVRQYFPNTGIASLTISESAFLAGLPQSPSYYGTNIEAALNRQKMVIAKMKELGYLNPSFPNRLPSIQTWNPTAPNP